MLGDFLLIQEKHNKVGVAIMPCVDLFMKQEHRMVQALKDSADLLVSKEYEVVIGR